MLQVTTDLIYPVLSTDIFLPTHIPYTYMCMCMCAYARGAYLVEIEPPCLAPEEAGAAAPPRP